jgi:hypothetical protein
MRLIYAGLSIAVVIHTGINVAQSQPSTQATPAGQSAASPAITVTGCLQSGAAGVPGAAADSAQFVLTKVIARTDAKEPSPKPTGAAGAGTPGAASAAVGTTGSMQPVSQYIVHGRDDELAKHAGQRVEIVGTASVAPPVPAGAPDTQVIPHEPQRGPVSTVATPGGATQSGTAHPSVQHLSVQSMRMVAAGCQ